MLNAPDIVLAKLCPCEPASPAALTKPLSRLPITENAALNIDPRIDIAAPIPENITVNTLPTA